MKQDIKNIDYEWLFKPTGDPFVDAGGYALEEFSHYYPDANLMDLIEKAASIYVNKWGGKVHAFFLNSPITQTAFKGKEKIETLKYYQSLINNVNGKQGFCRITGRYGYVFVAGRNNSILTGSGTYVNFHHDFQNGIMVSKEIIIRCFFLPLACEQLQGRISLLNCSNPEITAFFAELVCRRNMEAINNNISKSVFKSKSASTSTALFRFVDEVLRNKTIQFEEHMQCDLRMYLYTNFGASPDLQIISLPFPIWHFYRFVMKSKYCDNWCDFVSQYYYIKGGKYISNGEYNLIVGKEVKKVTENDFKYWDNKIYKNLINGKSILPEMLVYSKKEILDFNIVKIYAIKIRKMKVETIEKINQMADFIIANNDDRNIGKAMTKLNAVTNSFLLRRFILNDIVKPNYDGEHEEAIVTVKDYVEYLFPDSDSWKEMRDVLLIAIYERLHKLKKKVNIEDNKVL